MKINSGNFSKEVRNFFLTDGTEFGTNIAEYQIHLYLLKVQLLGIYIPNFCKSNVISLSLSQPIHILDTLCKVHISKLV